jgi:hypothetical protein
MVDTATGETSSRDALRALGSRIAVAGGSFAALLSLLYHVPASTAALRGGATWLVVLLVSRLGAHALGLAQRLDEAAASAEQREARTTETHSEATR